MNNFKTALKTKADELSLELQKNSLFFELGRKNMMTHFHVATYVVNLEHLFRKNCLDILEASKVYSSHQEVSEFFLHKWQEEHGHDAWARADWVAMSKERSFKSEPTVLSQMNDLTDFLNHVMHTSPYEYISYMYYAEYMTALVGPELMGLIKSNLGMENKQISALSNHIELDGDHASEVADALQALNLSDEDQLKIINFGTKLFARYNNFFNALAVINGNEYTNRRASESISADA